MGAEVHFAADLGRECVRDQVTDERVEHRLAVVGATEVLVTVVDLEVSDLERHVLHQAVEERHVDR